ncbi:MAG: hypothetical protein AMJ60_04170 [Desulfobacterales bacterium SG8_35]|nr:MAG: hypothetical protein AMJ60_04170 [Desulfobacterales bacterium SG8_35]
MKCFNHPAREAVAICKACGRAVCPDCGLDSEGGIACRQSCAQALLDNNKLYAKQAAHLKNIKQMNFLGSFFSIGMGCLFIYFSSQGFGLVYDFVFLLGAGFTVYGIMAQLVIIFIFLKSKYYMHR